MNFKEIDRNIKNKKGWTLCGLYLEYKSDGGKLSPNAWNNRINEMKKELKK